MQFADANSAAGHLLRNLHNARALRHNPLVAHLFAEQERAGEPKGAALKRVHEIVVATARQILGGEGTGRGLMHKQRQLEIVMRCDIGGELHKAVQLDLGLGARQFYRERERARTQLAKALEALVPAKLSEPGATLDPHGLVTAHIRAARERADDEFAMRLIREELESATDVAHRHALLATLAEIQTDAGEFAQARTSIEAIQALGLQDFFSKGRVLQVEALLAYVEGRFYDSASLCDSALETFGQLPLPRSVEHEEQMALAYFLASIVKHGIGRYADSLGALHAAREIIERRPELPVRLKVLLLEQLGASQMVLPASRTMVESHLLEALALAQRNGLVRESVACTFYISALHTLIGDVEQGLEIGRRALSLGQQVFGRGAYAWYCIVFARGELTHGFIDNAIRLARTARACNDSDVCIAFANAIVAEALLQRDDAERAYVLALSSIEPLRRAEHTAVLGIALQVASEAAFRLGRVEYARFAINEAIALLEQYGHPATLTPALRALETITGGKKSTGRSPEDAAR